MRWTAGLRSFPLRTKVLITVIGTGIALLGVTTHLSFRYWKQEAVFAAQQQALLAASSARTAVELALQGGRQEQARRTLSRLIQHEPVRAARVYGTDGSVLITATGANEGRRASTVWLPSVRELPATGVAHVDSSGLVVHAFVPVSVPPAAILEVEYSIGALRQAMDRGARLGLALVVGSVLALATILFTMLEREVVGPIVRASDLIEPDVNGARTDEVTRLVRGVEELIEKEQRAGDEQRRWMQEQAGFAQVGEMAAEMAHEFKRPLASIQSALSLLSQEYVIEDRGQSLIGAVEDQLERLSETMRDLFSLAKPVAVQAEHLSLREIFDRSLMQLAGHPATAGITVVREFPAADVVINGDPKRIEQVMVNLMLNAAEAMHEGGTMTLRFGAAPDAAWFTVTDTGCGIPASEVEKVLLPFYSTKPSGTGLGLPLVARVVAAHEGRLHIDSQPGRGTTIRVDLPPVSPSVAFTDRRRAG